MVCFRLLTELYSFLSYLKIQINSNKVYELFPSPYGVIFILIRPEINKQFALLNGFRLLTELYSFLYAYDMFWFSCGQSKFPSPYGVIFILINV